jgi:uncharacterized protein YqjF (DUF2071 family)
MKLPVIQGTIRRRILANFRVDPEVMQRQIPSRFRPKLQNGYAVAGICLIRLEHIRPRATPALIGLASENAAHRVAVTVEDAGAKREAVFISRRDTDSLLNHALGGRIFPGEHHHACFSVVETDSRIDLKMRSKDGGVLVELSGTIAEHLPSSSIFSSLPEASSFFEAGSTGYSVTQDPKRLDGLKLQTKEWTLQPLDITRVYSSYFSDHTKFPEGAIEFDHALIMRNLEHEWHNADDLYI